MRAAGFFHFEQFPAVDNYLGGGSGTAFSFAGGQRHPANTGDARQGLASKSHGGDGTQIFGASNFAGRVALQATQRIVPAHADAVVGDPDQAAPAHLDFDGDTGRFGIERIFDQLLDHTGWTLDDFASRDLVGDLLGEQADPVHGRGTAGACRGKEKEKMAPPPGRLRAEIFPWCSSMIFCVMDRPRPVPRGFPKVTKASNKCSTTSGAIPFPVSSISVM